MGYTCSHLTESKTLFHITLITQINKSVVYFSIRHSVKILGVLDVSLCINFDVKSGPWMDGRLAILRPIQQ